MKRGLLAAALRLFAFQGSMNHERLQGLGMAVAIEPLLRDLDGGPTGARYRSAVGRAAAFFNTHPYLAGLAVGAVAKAEHSGVPAQQVDRLRTALKGPLGSLGDRIVWAGVLPVSAAVGLILCTITHPLVAAAVFLLVYNAIHLLLRLWCLHAGWSAGVRVVERLRQPLLQAGLKYAGRVTALATGLALPVVGAWLTADFAPAARWGTGAVALVTIAVTRWIAPTAGAARLGIVALGVTLILGWVW